jgi:hypothetical protein
VHTLSFGIGAKSFEPPLASRWHAMVGLLRDPPGGLQRSVHVTALAEASSQYVTRSDVAEVPASASGEDARVTATSAIARCARMHSGYCHWPCPDRRDAGPC